ncbi:MAG: hypothetical protein HW421_3636 [Ignavibacteria bacterium]|nr:hypothetical protein [Ignavibacteria bacterium]
MHENINYVEVTPENISEYGCYCIKDKNAAGAKAKTEWFKSKFNNGIKIIIACDSDKRQLGFIEYIPSEQAWRPVSAENYLFIHCIAIFVKGAKRKELGSALLKLCEEDAKANTKSGICTIASSGAWMADKSLFEKNGYEQCDELDKFELMVKKFNSDSAHPKLINWKENQKQYQGWNLVYSDQCPWHTKSVNDLKAAALDFGIDLKITGFENPADAQNSPSGFGTYSLIRDGRLLEAHYISKTRFLNILKKEIA